MGDAFTSNEVLSLSRWQRGFKIHREGTGADYQSTVSLPRPKGSVLASSAVGRALESSLQQLLTNARKESPEAKRSVSEQKVKWILCYSLKDDNDTAC